MIAFRTVRPALRRALLAAAVLLAAVVGADPATAVVVLDETWKAEGGAKGREAEGFGAHLRLAAEPQFRAVLALARPDGEWGEASGTWIGNDDDGHAWILTAAHVYDLPAEAGAYVVREPNGRTLVADQIRVHPKWNGDTDTRTGYDLALLRLKRPISDAGQPPLLYAGAAEAGKLVTFVGYGNRGIGSKGEGPKFYKGSAKAAAQGIVDQWVDMVRPLPRDDDGGNYLGVFLPREDGSLANPYGGARKPVNRLVGLLGAGDSGGSTWMRLGERWVIVGVNSNGTGKARYGDSSWMARVSPHREWITSIFPGARFVER
ncbi:MAG: trypsin-like serine protease [Siculibacillus sp.]